MQCKKATADQLWSQQGPGMQREGVVLCRSDVVTMMQVTSHNTTQEVCVSKLCTNSSTEGKLREAYKAMLLQQQTRHRNEIARRQAKQQHQLDAQVGHTLPAVSAQSLHILSLCLL